MPGERTFGLEFLKMFQQQLLTQIQYLWKMVQLYWSSRKPESHRWNRRVRQMPVTSWKSQENNGLSKLFQLPWVHRFNPIQAILVTGTEGKAMGHSAFWAACGQDETFSKRFFEIWHLLEISLLMPYLSLFQFLIGIEIYPREMTLRTFLMSLQTYNSGNCWLLLITKNRRSQNFQVFPILHLMEDPQQTRTNWSGQYEKLINSFQLCVAQTGTTGNRFTNGSGTLLISGTV